MISREDKAKQEEMRNRITIIFECILGSCCSGRTELLGKRDQVLNRRDRPEPRSTVSFSSKVALNIGGLFCQFSLIFSWSGFT